MHAFAALVFSLLAIACGQPEPRRVRVFAAASLREACDDVSALWRTAHPDVELVFNFAASNVLAQQIEASRAADLFLSADLAQMERVRGAGVIAVDGPLRWLSNQLVVVAPASAGPFELVGASQMAEARFRRLSLANPEAVPAGKYAAAWLRSEGVWDALAPRIAPATDVRAALAAVEAGACDLGVVYSTDAAASSRVRVVMRVPAEDGPRIEYAIAALRGPAPIESAELALAHFTSASADECFARRGFLVGERP